MFCLPSANHQKTWNKKQLDQNSEKGNHKGKWKKEKQQKKMCPDTGKRHKSKVIKYDGSLGQGLMHETGIRQGCKWEGLWLRYGIREKDTATKAKRIFVRVRRS